jgi:hypothetical protein
MNLDDIQKLYDAGNTEMIATMQTGEKQPLRLFVSTSGTLGYFAKGKHRRGYAVRDIIDNVVSVKVKSKKDKTVIEEYLDNLRKFKKAYTELLHKNLWPNLRDGYNRLNLSDFEEFINQYAGEKNSSYDLYLILCEYCKLHNLDLNTENHYKTTTIKSNAPKNYSSMYNTCVANIGKQLENKENFHYSWQSNYDVSVEGKLCDDDIYRAWFSLEFRGCGNGHYYLLVNENQAVFAEDD